MEQDKIQTKETAPRLPYPIEVKNADNAGYIVHVGCQTLVFTRAEEMAAAFTLYVSDPATTMENHFKQKGEDRPTEVQREGVELNRVVPDNMPERSGMMPRGMLGQSLEVFDHPLRRRRATDRQAQGIEEQIRAERAQNHRRGDNPADFERYLTMRMPSISELNRAACGQVASTAQASR